MLTSAYFRGKTKAAHNQFKVDCHFVFYYIEKLIDIGNLEAARYLTCQKTNSDHLKLAIESKDILAFFLSANQVPPTTILSQFQWFNYYVVVSLFLLLG